MNGNEYSVKNYTYEPMQSSEINIFDLIYSREYKGQNRRMKEL